MSNPVRILHLEDHPSDSELVSAELRKGGLKCEIRLVGDRPGFEAALASGGLDVILADCRLPAFDGLTALKLAREHAPGVPFLFVSGFIGEEAALESLKQGATDYVFKHNLARLAPAVRRALEEAEDQRQRRQAEAALQESEATLRSFFDTAPFLMGMVELLDEDILHLSDNAAAARFFGRPPGETGRHRAREMGFSTPIIQRWLEKYREAGRLHKPVQFEYTHQSGASSVQLSVTVSELPATPNQARRFCYVAQDITARKQLEQQFLRAQRMESIGTMAGGVAHDLNNVLAPIIMCLKLFQPKLTDPEDAELMVTLESSARRGADIVRQLLTFARGAESERQPVDVKRVIRDLSVIIRDTFPRSIEFTLDVAEDLGQVMGDATQIYQVLMNLTVNARDAMPDGGRLTVRAENVSLDEHTARFHAEGRPGQYVTLSVVDSGVGIPPDQTVRIFDAFYTTKNAGKGTGLGLPTALTIVQGHRGFINVYSEPGRGTEFKVYLPAEPQSEKPGHPANRAAVPRGNGELVLVVDDDAAIRQVTRAALIDQGYTVLTARDGAEAAVLFARRESEIKVVITDLMMPVMGGSALIQSLQKLDPNVCIIAVSGLLEGSPFPHSAGSGQITFLQKPFTAEKLLETVHEVLHQAVTPLLL